MAAEEGKGEDGPESWERAGEDADAFFDDGPEPDFSSAEHEFRRVAVETEVAEPDDRCAACTGGMSVGCTPGFIGVAEACKDIANQRKNTKALTKQLAQEFQPRRP